ncbi:MAG: phosphatase PAP2 family protein [Thermoleophilia bacterium]|jgi:undecaprenyl-diphosphatase|nr:phosphatase PAP2 family protein [Thermoleophilia bacterium]
MRPLARLDRRAGRALRRAVDGRPALGRAARAAAAALSPGYRVMVAALVAHPATRPAGVRALAAGVLAGTAARLLRDRVGRRRPGPRPDGGFPSRHAAAAVAIAAAVAPTCPAARAALWGSAAVGLAARVAAAQHDPADIVAGALLGLGAAGAVWVVRPR